MKKLPKRYYILIFIAALAAGVIIREFNTSTFEIVKNSAVYAPAEETEYVTDVQTESIVNINTADEHELTSLKGIGDALAARIIDYRTKNGKFEVIQDIMKVEGIGEKKFESFKQYITVE